MQYWPPVLFAVFVWWLSTGVIFFLVGLPRRSFRWSMLVASLLFAVSMRGLAITASDPGISAAYVAFSCAVLMWGWQEMAFLMGFISGPRRHACSPGCAGWPHFVHATEAVIYHEFAIFLGAVAVMLLTWNGVNQVGAWTYLVLWAMRLSAKLNLFLGVRNLSEELLPEHLKFLHSFFTRKPMNLLFPVSIVVSSAAAMLMVQRVIAPDTVAGSATGLTLAATLLALAIVEHLFLVLPLPLPTESLWGWGLRSRTPLPVQLVPAAQTDPPAANPFTSHP